MMAIAALQHKTFPAVPGAVFVIAMQESRREYPAGR
jgi:hypothetical protein